MRRVVVDEVLRSKLQNLERPLELCDGAGRVLGRFVPVVDLSEWEPVTPEVSEHELDRRENSAEPRYDTAEVLAYLERL